jgi:hypothetical protein
VGIAEKPQIHSTRACGASLNVIHLVGSNDLLRIEEPGPKGLLVWGVFRGAEAHAFTEGGLVSALSHIPNVGCGGTRICLGAEIAGTADPSPFAMLRVRMTFVWGMVWISALLSWMRLRRALGKPQVPSLRSGQALRLRLRMTFVRGMAAVWILAS